MRNEIIDARLTALRSRAEKAHTRFCTYVGITALDGAGLTLDLINQHPNKVIGLITTVGVIGGIYLSADKGMEAVQAGQEVATLAAVQAQFETQT
jgi:hypothetical protein